MPQAHLQADAIGLPTNRRQIEQQIDALIDLLDTIDTDPDLEPDADLEPPLGWTELEARFGAHATPIGEDEDGADDEPSLGFSTGGHFPENQRQEGLKFHMNANGGDDCEDEHDGAEPDADPERNLGWANEGGQLGVWYSDHNETEASSPEWPAEHPTWQPPKRRVVAPPVPTISIRDCVRVSR